MKSANDNDLIPSQEGNGWVPEVTGPFSMTDSGVIILPTQEQEQTEKLLTRIAKEESAPPVIETPKNFKRSAKEDLDLLEERIQKLEKRIVYSSNDKRELDKRVEEMKRLPKNSPLDINYNPFTEQSAKEARETYSLLKGLFDPEAYDPENRKFVLQFKDLSKEEKARYSTLCERSRYLSEYSKVFDDILNYHKNLNDLQKLNKYRDPKRMDLSEQALNKLYDEVRVLEEKKENARLYEQKIKELKNKGKEFLLYEQRIDELKKKETHLPEPQVKEIKKAISKLEIEKKKFELSKQEKDELYRQQDAYTQKKKEHVFSEEDNDKLEKLKTELEHIEGKDHYTGTKYKIDSRMQLHAKLSALRALKARASYGTKLEKSKYRGFFIRYRSLIDTIEKEAYELDDWDLIKTFQDLTKIETSEREIPVVEETVYEQPKRGWFKKCFAAAAAFVAGAVGGVLFEKYTHTNHHEIQKPAIVRAEPTLELKLDFDTVLPAPEDRYENLELRFDRLPRRNYNSLELYAQ